MTQRIQRANEHFVPCVWDGNAKEWIPVGMADIYRTEEGAYRGLLRSIADEWNAEIEDVAGSVRPGLPCFGEDSHWTWKAASQTCGSFWRLVDPDGHIAEIYAIRRAIVGP